MAKTKNDWENSRVKGQKLESLKIIQQNPTVKSPRVPWDFKSHEHTALWWRVKCQAHAWAQNKQHDYKIREQYWAEKELVGHSGCWGQSESGAYRGCRKAGVRVDNIRKWELQGFLTGASCVGFRAHTLLSCLTLISLFSLILSTWA